MYVFFSFQETLIDDVYNIIIFALRKVFSTTNFLIENLINCYISLQFFYSILQISLKIILKLKFLVKAYFT